MNLLIFYRLSKNVLPLVASDVYVICTRGVFQLFQLTRSLSVVRWSAFFPPTLRLILGIPSSASLLSLMVSWGVFAVLRLICLLSFDFNTCLLLVQTSVFNISRTVCWHELIVYPSHISTFDLRTRLRILLPVLEGIHRVYR